MEGTDLGTFLLWTIIIGVVVLWVMGNLMLWAVMERDTVFPTPFNWRIIVSPFFYFGWLDRYHADAARAEWEAWKEQQDRDTQVFHDLLKQNQME